jgi:hypothetical protein
MHRVWRESAQLNRGARPEASRRSTALSPGCPQICRAFTQVVHTVVHRLDEPLGAASGRAVLRVRCPPGAAAAGRSGTGWGSQGRDGAPLVGRRGHNGLVTCPASGELVPAEPQRDLPVAHQVRGGIRVRRSGCALNPASTGVPPPRAPAAAPGHHDGECGRRGAGAVRCGRPPPAAAPPGPRAPGRGVPGRAGAVGQDYWNVQDRAAGVPAPYLLTGHCLAGRTRASARPGSPLRGPACCCLTRPTNCLTRPTNCEGRHGRRPRCRTCH